MEEVTFRGILQEKFRLAITAVGFGLMHLGSLLLVDWTDNSAVNRVLLQTIVATAAGFYLGYVTEREGYSLEKAIALHYWNNVLAMNLSFLKDQGKTLNSTNENDEGGLSLGIGFKPSPSLVLSIELP